MKRFMAVCLILITSSAGALTQAERDAELACMGNIDMYSSTGGDVTKWKYKRGYEMCERVYPAIVKQRAVEEDEAKRNWTRQSQKDLKAAARDLGIDH